MSTSFEKRIKWSYVRHRYVRSGPKKRSQLLDELCDLTGMNRKYLIRKLNKKSTPLKQRRGPKAVYASELYQPILKTFWLACDQLCSKKLVSILEEWLPFYEREYGALESCVRTGLLSMSSATIDRLLRPIKVHIGRRRRSGTKPGTLIRNHIPIRTNQWEENRVGFIEADTVAHSGTSLSGDFVWSLTMTDIVTTWTENRATWNKGANGVIEQIEDVESVLPFKLRGFDCDNGSEFLNYHLLAKFTNRPKNKQVAFTRSRPYKKNDNAHVEQKNWTHVRQLFGYHRFDKPLLVELINDLYRQEWSLYQNHFIPTTKCIEKVKVTSKYKKRFDKAQTPYQRVLACAEVPASKTKALKALHKTLNPFELKRQIEKKLKVIFQHAGINTKPRKKI